MDKDGTSNTTPCQPKLWPMFYSTHESKPSPVSAGKLLPESIMVPTNCSPSQASSVAHMAASFSGATFVQRLLPSSTLLGQVRMFRPPGIRNGKYVPVGFAGSAPRVQPTKMQPSGRNEVSVKPLYPKPLRQPGHDIVPQEHGLAWSAVHKPLHRWPSPSDVKSLSSGGHFTSARGLTPKPVAPNRKTRLGQKLVSMPPSSGVGSWTACSTLGKDLKTSVWARHNDPEPRDSRSNVSHPRASGHQGCPYRFPPSWPQGCLSAQAWYSSPSPPHWWEVRAATIEETCCNLTTSGRRRSHTWVKNWMKQNNKPSRSIDGFGLWP